MKHLFTLAAFAGLLATALPVGAQDFGGRGDRGDRGGNRGDRGDRGDRGGDRGDRGGDRGGSMFGGFPGGPPSGFGGGGFSGGPPVGFGGPPGGFGGPPGGFGGGFGGPPGGSDRGSRFGSMMDSNGNGQIDQDELDRMPSFVRDMMKARGVELKAGMSLDDMRNSMSRGFSGGPGGPGGNPGDPNANANGQGQRPKALTPYRMKPRKPITLALPPAYAEVDVDYDGQLGMHEWMMTRRAEIEQFEAMDVDFDGFLTPEELQAAEVAAAAAGGQPVAAAEARQRLTIVSATPAKSKNANQPPNGTPNGQPGQPQPGGFAWGGRGPGDNGGGEAAMAPAYFSRLDQNGNGVIEANEWQESRRVRGMFEQAGIRLDNMNLQQFTENLTRVTASQQGQPQGR